MRLIRFLLSKIFKKQDNQVLTIPEETYAKAVASNASTSTTEPDGSTNSDTSISSERLTALVNELKYEDEVNETDPHEITTTESSNAVLNIDSDIPSFEASNESVETSDDVSSDDRIVSPTAPLSEAEAETNVSLDDNATTNWHNESDVDDIPKQNVTLEDEALQDSLHAGKEQSLSPSSPPLTEETIEEEAQPFAISSGPSLDIGSDDIDTDTPKDGPLSEQLIAEKTANAEMSETTNTDMNAILEENTNIDGIDDSIEVNLDSDIPDMPSLGEEEEDTRIHIQDDATDMIPSPDDLDGNIDASPPISTDMETEKR